MDYLNTRKTLLEQKKFIDTNAERLKKLTDNIPGGIIQLRISNGMELITEFISEGILKLYPMISLERWRESPQLYFTIIHPDDLENLQKQFIELFKKNDSLHIEFRVKTGDDYRWHSINCNSEKMDDGSTTFYGIIYDINDRIEYEIAMEQMAFDISHVLRRPVTTLLGLNNLIESEKNISKSKMLEYVGYIKTVSKEMDEYTRNLNKIYQMKRDAITNKNSESK